MHRKQIAHETVQILEQGHYQTSQGLAAVSIIAQLKQCVDNTQCYNPENLVTVQKEVLLKSKPVFQTQFEVINETTLVGAKRLAEEGEGCHRIGVLNFASAKNPGGGFLKGAHAQEESLARSSGLYQSLLQCRSYYNYHRSQKSCLYSDWMIYSPRCPVFRQDNGTLLESPYLVDFITSPAPNAGVVYRREPENIAKIPEVLRERSSKVLSLAAYHGCDALVLGAWGCGVFQNNPAMVAQTFFEHLCPPGKFEGYFQKVIFSILNTSSKRETYKVFEECFGRFLTQKTPSGTEFHRVS